MTGPWASELWREAARKTFHLLSLAYLAAYQLIGYPAVLRWMIAWAIVVAAIETARLRSPRLNEALTGFFAGLARPEEKDRFSGIIHTTLGALIVFAAFGARPQVVAGAIYCVALGDAAAALVGKSLGRVRICGGRKSLEGTAACFATCFICCRVLGFSGAAATAAAATATAVEALPTTRWFNDNLWLPVAAGRR